MSETVQKSDIKVAASPTRTGMYDENKQTFDDVEKHLADKTQMLRQKNNLISEQIESLDDKLNTVLS